MSLRVCVGLTKMVGQDNYGSLEASCTIEADVDSSTVHDHPGLQDDIRRLYAAVWQSVHEELCRR